MTGGQIDVFVRERCVRSGSMAFRMFVKACSVHYGLPVTVVNRAAIRRRMSRQRLLKDSQVLLSLKNV